MSALTEFLAGQPHAHTCATFGQHTAPLSRCSCWQRGVLEATEADNASAVAVGVAILEGRGLDLSDVTGAAFSLDATLGGIR